jgi:hypothetical protein
LSLPLLPVQLAEPEVNAPGMEILTCMLLATSQTMLTMTLMLTFDDKMVNDC